jgi:hypothetical protein
MIPVDAATRHGIPVANVPGADAQAVAEYVVGSFFNLARRFGEFNAALRTYGWATARQLSGSTLELSGKVVGIVGVGDIGRRVAHICSAGLGMKVFGYQPDASRFPDFVRSIPLDILLAECDYVAINCPLTPSTRHLIDFGRLMPHEEDGISGQRGAGRNHRRVGARPIARGASHCWRRDRRVCSAAHTHCPSVLRPEKRSADAARGSAHTGKLGKDERWHREADPAVNERRAAYLFCESRSVGVVALPERLAP